MKARKHEGRLAINGDASNAGSQKTGRWKTAACKGALVARIANEAGWFVTVDALVGLLVVEPPGFVPPSSSIFFDSSFVVILSSEGTAVGFSPDSLDVNEALSLELDVSLTVDAVVDAVPSAGGKKHVSGFNGGKALAKNGCERLMGKEIG